MTDAEKVAEATADLVRAYQKAGQVAILIVADQAAHVQVAMPDMNRGVLSAIVRTALDALRDPAPTKH